MIEGARGDALAEELEAMHLGFDKAAAVIAAQLFPDRPAKPFGCAQCFIAGVNARAIFGPRPPVAAYRDDLIGTVLSDDGMTASPVIFAIGGSMKRHVYAFSTPLHPSS